MESLYYILILSRNLIEVEENKILYPTESMISSGREG
jgi:hypothetical protein